MKFLLIFFLILSLFYLIVASLSNSINTRDIIPLVINGRKRGNEKPYNPKFVKSSLNKITSSNLDRLEEINETLTLIHKESPLENYDFTDITEIIGNYDTDESFEHLNFITIYMPNFSFNEIDSLDFYDNNFAKTMHSTLLFNYKKNKVSGKYSYWIALGKLFFKWMIYMRRIIKDNDEFEREILDPLRLLGIMINKRINYVHFGFNFEMKSMKPDSIKNFQEILKIEFFHNPSIFSIFASAIEYFYLNRDGKVMICQDLLKHFFNGRFDNNPLLKYLIVIHDPMGMMRECIIKDDPHLKNLQISPSIQMITREYLSDLRFKGPSDLDLLSPVYPDAFVFKFFLSHDRRFQIQNCCKLIFLLEAFDDLGRLAILKESVEKIIEFKLDNGTMGWNQRIFRQYIKNHLYHDHYHQNYDKLTCKAYLKMFTGTDLISQFIELFD